MHVPDNVKQVFQQHGPFATAYLDATRSTESGATEVELRWRALRKQLEDGGTDSGTLGALDAAIEEIPDAPGPRGRVLVAAGGTVLFDEVLPQPPVRELASWSPLPALVPYLAQRGPAIAHVLVVADLNGADISAVSAQHAAEGLGADRSGSVEGSSPYPISKTSVRDWSEQHFQQRVENSWVANARDVADAVRSFVTAVDAEAVIVAGDPRARSLICQDLPEVLTALQRAQADTVVLSDDPSSPLRAWIGPEPLQVAETAEDLAAMGVSEPRQDRYDSAMLRAVAGSDAELLITPNAHEYVQGGIGALLRYADEATPSA